MLLLLLQARVEPRCPSSPAERGHCVNQTLRQRGLERSEARQRAEILAASAAGTFHMREIKKNVCCTISTNRKYTQYTRYTLDCMPGPSCMPLHTGHSLSLPHSLHGAAGSLTSSPGRRPSTGRGAAGGAPDGCPDSSLLSSRAARSRSCLSLSRSAGTPASCSSFSMRRSDSALDMRATPLPSSSKAP